MTIWIPDLTEYAGPRYKALATAIALGIDAGELIAQQKLPPQRQLADALGVTLGTVTRGYAEAERRGLVSARVGSGTYVNEKGAKVRDEFLIPDPREGFIDLTVSLPVRLGQQALLSETLGELQHDPDTLAHMLEYHPDGGFEHHRQVIAKWISYGNFAPPPDSITLCNGGQHAIQLALIAACRPGDTILAEGLAYPGLKSIARQLSLKVIPIPMDEQGILLDSIADLCRQYNPRLIYCTPTQHNPTNVQMTLQRRRQLISVADECQLLIIEDDVSASLVQNRPEPLASMAPERVFYISSCSKGLAGGLRVGFLVSPQAYRDRAASALRASCWMAPPLMVEIACRWIQQGAATQLLAKQREALQVRFALVRDIFRSLDFSARADSFFVWLVLPEHWRASAFVKAAEEKKVLITAAESFAVGNYPAPQAVRICISAAKDLASLEEGLRMIQQLALSEVDEKIETF